MKNDIKNLTLEEKFELLSGNGVWAIHDFNGKLDKVIVSDGPCGLRKMEPDENGKLFTVKSTIYPSVHVLANSWNKQLAKTVGNAIADDCIDHDVDIILAPGVNIKRHPLNGRNFEYFSEDPYLAGTLAKEYILGVQEKGIGTSLKHYVANNFEQDRLLVSSEIDERTLREIYIKPFEIALQANPVTIMSSYNKINGVWASEHAKLVKRTLREELGFKGLVMSDWGAVHDRVKALKATTDLEMPDRKESVEELKKAYESGEITIEEIDFCVQNILNLINTMQSWKPLRKVTTTKEDRHKLAYQGALEGSVLLKNQDNILPLKGNEKIVVYSLEKDRVTVIGDGSARVETDYQMATLGDEIKRAMPKAEVEYLEPYTYWRGNVETKFLGEKLSSACDADVCVVFAGIDYRNEGEGFDRQSMRLQPRLEYIIKEISKINPNTIVVLAGGSAIETCWWDENVKAILYTGFAGEGMLEAAADLIAGNVSPSGKLSETFAYELEDYPTTTSAMKNPLVTQYTEGVFVGYRYFDFFEEEVNYPFGHGLSYANFEYSNLQIKPTGDFEAEVSYTITNTSKIDAKEVSQLYVKDMLSSVLR
ncbi:MAG: glycoside hydrolase family 3 protein, partial [Clostridia bacterium]|nr:glycoside hydrolase family 3 protein [Clostridia bacterium]